MNTEKNTNDIQNKSTLYQQTVKIRPFECINVSKDELGIFSETMRIE